VWGLSHCRCGLDQCGHHQQRNGGRQECTDGETVKREATHGRAGSVGSIGESDVRSTDGDGARGNRNSKKGETKPRACCQKSRTTSLRTDTSAEPGSFHPPNRRNGSLDRVWRLGLRDSVDRFRVDRLLLHNNHELRSVEEHVLGCPIRNNLRLRFGALSIRLGFRVTAF